MDAFVDGLSRAAGVPVKVLNYHEHSIGGGAQARAAAYVEVRVGDAPPVFGVGIDANIVRATLLAVLVGDLARREPVAVEQGARAVACGLTAGKSGRGPSRWETPTGLALPYVARRGANSVANARFSASCLPPRMRKIHASDLMMRLSATARLVQAWIRSPEFRRCVSRMRLRCVRQHYRAVGRGPDC